MKNSHLSSFEKLLEDREIVFRICLGFSKDPWTAEELAQEVYLKVHQNLHSIMKQSSTRIWLFRITRNICIDFVRKNKDQPVGFFKINPNNSLIDKKTPEYLFFQKEQVKILKKIIARLSKKLKEVLVLREYGHLSYEEISEILKIKEGTVMSRLYLARQAVINQMRSQNGK